MQAITEAAHLIISDGEAAFPKILELGAFLVNADYGNIFIFDKDSRTLKLIAKIGDSGGQNSLPQEFPIDRSSIAGFTAQTGRSYLSLDVRKDPHYYQSYENVRSVIAIPLRVAGQVLGVISFESTKLNAFTYEHDQLLEILASFIGFALRRKEDESRISVSKEILDSKKPLAFVLMPFRDPFDKYYRSIIKPAIEDSGMLALRADEIYGPTEIVKDIWKAINDAKIIVAELTTRNPNVLYELGLCHAIGKHVIMLSQSVDDLPFDLRSLRCILYDTIEPNWAELLRQNLMKSIEKATSDGASEIVFLQKNKP